MIDTPREDRDLRALLGTLATFSARPARWHLLITFLLTLADSASLLLLLPLLQLIGVDGSQTPAGSVTARVFGVLGIQPTLATVLLAYVAVVTAQSLLRRQRRVLGVAVEESLALGLRRRVYRALATADWTFLAGRRSSDATHILTKEIDRVASAGSQTLDIVASAVMTAVYVALALRFSPPLTAVILGLGAVLALFVRRPIERARTAGRRLSEASSAFYAAISEHFAGLKLAKGYGAETRHAQIFDTLAGQLGEMTLATHVEHARLQEVFAIGSAAVLAIVVYVSYTVLRVPTASLLFLLFLFSRLVPRLSGLYEQWHVLSASLPSLRAVSTLEHDCARAAQPAPRDPRTIALVDRLAFDRVTFAYPTNPDQPAVRNVSLSIEAGSTVAIVGSSGSGKSTLADLMMGLLTPDSGAIAVDGTPFGPETWDAWRAQLGVVPQDAFLFHDTVRANLAWARPDASEADLFEALHLAAADEFVRALPKGLDTVVGDRGGLVSGGERQRLSLARALLRQPRLLILDEATSSLDAGNERRICQAIERLRHRLTIVIISHRLSMVRSADIIHVLERGTIVESGTWTDLARKDGRFRALCLAQGVALSIDDQGMRDLALRAG